MSTRIRLFLLVATLLIAALSSLMVGAHWIGPATALKGLIAPAPEAVDQLIVRSSRLPRTVIAMVVGASLAVAGALMQTLTRNPLASPGLLGINAGATFAVVLLVAWAGSASLAAWSLGAFLGAALAAMLVWWVAMRGGASSHGPLRLVLAGAALSALFTAFSQALLVIDQQGLDTVLFWLAGAVDGRAPSELAPLMAVALAAGLGCIPLTRAMNVLAAGESMARGLGIKVHRLQALMVGLVVALSGASVAMAGNITFVGLIVPHMARRLLPADHRIFLPGCALLGATLLIVADVIGRSVAQPREIPVGVMTALIGAPMFIALLNRQRSAHG
ncbi:FecCD family ABC transporter permease [Larsenimonas suaedae]|uniref:Iron ABC transporter permease n=1 Tax=Larsenimonas suaedae TaxID=1851019 RepID=A0ABU1GT51_9GAMM|nr:iron ABC transporter permease [Larsenimonas suaedae]MCM2972532.1 iron ABC transporter permease [Larsenimonas suaedae]MDR5894672.1 iron ABC transporter permease [Larsenimonas suaedae]